MLVNRIKIEIQGSVPPSSYAVLAFAVTDVAISYEKLISKTFTYSTPPSSGWVQIGTTLLNLFNNLVANDQDGNMIFSYHESHILIDFQIPALYNLVVFDDAYDVFLVTTEEFQYTEPVISVDPFIMKHLQIEIIDTYENDLALQVEVTKASAPTLSYDGGDDIYEPLYTSNLKFNMRVADFADAHFLHLFTGDEKRFKVKLNAINEEEEVQLYWQGFLLPDMLREPYTNNNLFVEFEAIDMLASLKGKYFKPWQYYQRYNITKLLAMMFAETGISQPMLIRPSIIPATGGVTWQSINVPLLTYVDGGKYTDIYTILTDVLQSNLLTCYSFKGIWYIDGVTRKNETFSKVLSFDANGNFEIQKKIFKEFISPEPLKESLYFTAKTPWKAVVAEFEYKGRENVLPDDVVLKDVFYKEYTNDEYNPASPSTDIIDYWKSTGNKIGIVAEKSFLQMLTGITVYGLTDIYNVSAAESLNHYVELKNSFYLYSGFNYEIEIVIDFRRVVIFDYVPEDFVGYPDETFYDDLNKWVQIQVIQNGVEILTNREAPSSSSTFKWQYGGVSYPQEGNVISTDVEIRIKKQFVLSQSGNSNIRFLAMKGIMPLGFGVIAQQIEITPKVLKINVINAEHEGIVGKRPVNYTNVYTHPFKFISSPDESVLNNFGLGIQQTPYEEIIPVGTQSVNSSPQYFPNGDVLFIQTWLFHVTADMFKKMFKDNRLKSVYIVRNSGIEEHFYSWYGRSFSGGQVAHYVNFFDHGVVIPKDYKEQAKIETGDVLKMALSNYPSENLNNRSEWKIYDETDIRSFMQTAIAACHNVRPSQLWVMEGVFLDLVWPDQIQQFTFNNEERNFINTRLTLDLFNGNTSVYGREFKYENLTDITYE